MVEVATNFQMADVTTNCQMTEVANKCVNEFQSAEVDAILKQAGENKLIVPGGWTPLNPHDPHIQELGKFAVHEHNKNAKHKLVFVNVPAGLQKLGESFTLYWLIITAQGPTGLLGLYKALVKEFHTNEIKKLIYFEEVAP